ncbi:MAG: 3-phosphoshikimate 1-carboxyvinyltransferase [Pirellulaceae bacterium]
MPDSIEIQTCGPVEATIRPPGSKSITNRALICAAMATGRTQLVGALHSEDTEVMVASLNQLGIAVQANSDAATIDVEGCSGRIPVSEATLQVVGSGTSMRFLTAMCATARGRFVLDGNPRMRERPIGDLTEALNQLGGDVSSADGFPPVEVQARGLPGGSARVRSDQSSQFLSAVLMALPFTEKFTVVQTHGSLVSRPYINMTCQVMGHFGVDVLQMSEVGEYSVDPRHIYTGFEYDVEPDASAASYYWAAAAITGGSVKVPGLKPDALQGDVRFVQLLEEMGCEISVDDEGITVSGRAEQGIDVNMSDISDTAMTLAAVALFAETPTTIRGIAHNRLKETDRIGNLAIELRKLGATVDEFEDGLAITPGKLTSAEIDTYNDHRMAMALSLVGLQQPGVVIRDPGCVEKTYPRFFEDLARVTGGW